MGDAQERTYFGRMSEDFHTRILLKNFSFGLVFVGGSPCRVGDYEKLGARVGVAKLLKFLLSLSLALKCELSSRVRVKARRYEDAIRDFSGIGCFDVTDKRLEKSDRTRNIAFPDGYLHDKAYKSHSYEEQRSNYPCPILPL